MKLKSIFAAAVLLLLNSLSLAQDETTTRSRSDMMKTWPMSDTKSIQSYYKNIFSTKKEEKESSFGPTFDIDKQKLLEKLKEAVPLQGPVDPKEYILGPGDLLDISIFGSIPASFTLAVSPEGSLVIPTVGVILVAGKTLDEIKSKVENKVTAVYKNSNVATTLIYPRIFSVTVGGVVNNPGNFYASSVQRVDEVVYLANLKTNLAVSTVSDFQKPNEQLLDKPNVIKYFRNDELRDQKTEMSLRNIKLIRKNGDTLNVDLVRFYATGDSKYNPFLMDGDRIYIPNLDLEGNSITISGEVRLEGTYEFCLSDSITSVYAISQGPTKIADLENVNLYRTNLTTGEVNKQIINFQEVLEGKASDVKLFPGDRIVFRKIYPRESPLSVTIKGEVLLPGLYPIIKNKTRIMDVISEAGGFTKDASLKEAKIIRFYEPLDKALTNPDYQRLDDMRKSNLNTRQREYFNYEYSVKRDFVAVDFHELFLNNNEAHNVILIDGDMIIIPPKSETIYVYGQIAKDGYYDYVDGEDYLYYINLAGGLTKMAEEGKIMVIKAGNRNWIEPDKTTIEPGDAIWIPRGKDLADIDFEYYFWWFVNIVTVLAGVATVIIVVQK